jgi:hypothetical protein
VEDMDQALILQVVQVVPAVVPVIVLQLQLTHQEVLEIPHQLLLRKEIMVVAV